MPADLIAPVLSDFTAEFAAYPGDGDAWGTFDFYPEFAALLRRAVASGTHFDTGWVGVKKAPMNFRIRWTPTPTPMAPGTATARCQVSVSDDFDTSGLGEQQLRLTGASPDAVLEALQEALVAAAAAGVAERVAAEAYAGFSVGVVAPDGREDPWVYTLLLPRDGDFATPPGGAYAARGWDDQAEPDPAAAAADAAPDPFPAAHRAACRAWAERYLAGEAVGERFTAGAFTITLWT